MDLKLIGENCHHGTSSARIHPALAPAHFTQRPHPHSALWIPRLRRGQKPPARSCPARKNRRARADPTRAETLHLSMLWRPTHLPQRNCPHPPTARATLPPNSPMTTSRHLRISTPSGVPREHAAQKATYFAHPKKNHALMAQITDFPAPSHQKLTATRHQVERIAVRLAPQPPFHQKSTERTLASSITR